MTAPDQDTIFALAAAPHGACYVACRSGLYLADSAGQRAPLLHAPTGEPLAVTAVTSAANGSTHWLYAAVAGGVFRRASSALHWQHAALPTAAPIPALQASPTWQDDGALFAATLGDGVLCSADRGATWSAWNFGLLDRDVYCLAVSPDFARDGMLIAGTETGLFQSTSGGRAWRELPLPCDAPILACAVAPHCSTEFLIGTEGAGAWQSHDGGRAWHQCATPPDEPVLHVGFGHPSTPYTALALTPHALWAARDAWQAIAVPHAGEFVAMSAHYAATAGLAVGIGQDDGNVQYLAL